MKKLGMILTVLVIFGSAATIGHTSDECVVFEGNFEMSSRRPVAQFEYFQALDGEAILKLYDESEGRYAKKFTNATVSINGKKVIRSWDFSKWRFYRFWHLKKNKFYRYSHVNQQNDYIEKRVELIKGQNSLEVMLNGKRGEKIKVAIVKPKDLASNDTDCDMIPDDGDENGISGDHPCTGGSTELCDDNCPHDFNPDQADSDGDGIGDVCDDTDGYPYLVANTIAVGKNPYCGIAVSPDSEFVYVSNYGGNTVSVIKAADNSVIDIPVGTGPAGVSVTPDGAFAYVSNYGSNSVSVIDTSSNMVTQSIPVGKGPFGISMTPDGKHAYVCNYAYGSSTVSVIDTSLNSVTDIQVGSQPYGVSVTPDGAYAYVSNYGSGSVSIIRTSDNTLMPSIFVGGAPSGISVTPDGRYVYVGNYTSGTVWVIDTSDNNVTTIPVASGADGIAVTPSGAYVYVDHHSTGTVSVIQTSNNTVIDTINVGNQPYGGGIAVSPNGKFVYVGDYTDSIVSIIGF
jgi:YVTN family beta-propeller protein